MGIPLPPCDLSAQEMPRDRCPTLSQAFLTLADCPGVSRPPGADTVFCIISDTWLSICLPLVNS